MVSLSIKRQYNQRNHPVKAPKMGHLYTEAFGGHPLLLTFLRPIPCAGAAMADGAAEAGHGGLVAVRYLALTSAQKREALGELFLLLATRFNSEYEFGRHLKNSRIV